MYLGSFLYFFLLRITSVNLDIYYGGDIEYCSLRICGNNGP